MTPMTETATEELTPELIDRVRKLSPADKDRLCELAINPPDEADAANRAALKAELTRRWERLRSGEDQAIPAEDVIAELRRKAEARRAS